MTISRYRDVTDMTNREWNDYYQGPQRNPIQVERKERGDWIVWNWRRASWDELTHGVSMDGTPREHVVNRDPAA